MCFFSTVKFQELNCGHQASDFTHWAIFLVFLSIYLNINKEKLILFLNHCKRTSNLKSDDEKVVTYQLKEEESRLTPETLWCASDYKSTRSKDSCGN